MDTIRLKVWGDYACFTRPEMKVERVSYDVMTPSAARGILEAILWKPAIRWHIKKIEVLNPIRWISVRRNEVRAIVSTRNVKTAMKTGSGKLGLFIEDERQQRAGLFLRDISYIIHAHFELLETAGETDTPGKFLGMFERRASRGQCFHRPYLGCREFSAHFEFLSTQSDCPEPIAECRDLGWMLYDMDYTQPEEPMPKFFRAELKNGVMNIPASNSKEVRG
jgi:CRISPR-associated protein Cas5d